MLKSPLTFVLNESGVISHYVTSTNLVNYYHLIPKHFANNMFFKRELQDFFFVTLRVWRKKLLFLGKSATRYDLCWYVFKGQ